MKFTFVMADSSNSKVAISLDTTGSQKMIDRLQENNVHTIAVEDGEKLILINKRLIMFTMVEK